MRISAFAGLALVLGLSAASCDKKKGSAAREPSYQPAAAGTPMGKVSGRITRAGQALPGAVVFLRSPKAGAPVRMPQPMLINLGEGGFDKATYDGRVGDMFLFENPSPVAHQIQLSFSTGGKLMTVVAPASKNQGVGTALAGQTDLLCTLHPQERAVAVTVDHPYIAVSDPEGRFEWPEVGEGDATVVVIAGPDARIERDIEVEKDKPVTVQIDMPLEARIELPPQAAPQPL